MTREEARWGLVSEGVSLGGRDEMSEPVSSGSRKSELGLSRELRRTPSSMRLGCECVVGWKVGARAHW